MKSLPAHHLERAMREIEAHLLLDDPAGAQTAAASIIARQPGHLVARMRRAVALLRLGRAEEALKELDAVDLYRRTVVEIPYQRLNTWLRLRARAMIQLGRPRQARVLLHEAVSIRPDATALRMLGILSLRMDDVRNAVEWLSRAVEARPMDLRAMRWLAEAQERAGMAEEALGTLQRLGRLPRSWRLRVARLMQRAGRTVQAARLYHRLLADQPHHADLAAEAAALTGELGDDRRACRYLETALAAQPQHPKLLAALATQHMRCGRFVAAGGLWWRLRGNQPRDPVPLANLAVCAAAESRDRLVDLLTKRLRRVHGNQALRRMLIAQACQQASSGQMLTDMLQRKPAAPSAGVLEGLLSHAVRTFEWALEHRSNYADLHHHLGVAHAALGHEEAAAACWDEALKINPNYNAAAIQRYKLAA